MGIPGRDYIPDVKGQYGAGGEAATEITEQDLLRNAIELRGNIKDAPGPIRALNSVLAFGEGLVKSLGTASSLLELGDSVSKQLGQAIARPIRKFVRGSDIPEDIGSGAMGKIASALPGVSDIDKFLEGARGGAPSPGEQSPIAERFGEFVGATAQLGGLGEATSIPALLSNLLAGTVDVGLEEAGADPITRLLLTGGAGALGGAAGAAGESFARGGQKAMRGSPVRQVLAEEAGTIIGRRLTPDAVRAEFAKDLEKAGIPFSLGQVTEGGLVAEGINFAEKRLRKSFLGRDIWDKFSKSVEKATVNAYENVAREIGATERIAAEQAGMRFQELLGERLERMKAQAAQDYSQVDRVLGRDRLEGGKTIVGTYERFLNKLERSYSPNVEQNQVINVARKQLNRMKADLMDGTLPADAIIATKQSVGPMIDWEFGTGPRNLLKKLHKELDQMVKAHRPKNPKGVELYEQANLTFADSANRLRNNVMQRMIRSERPQEVINLMKTKKGLRKVERAIATNPEGMRVFDALRRATMDEIIGDHIYQAAENMRFGQVDKRLRRRDLQNQLRQLMGPKEWKDLSRLQRVAKGIAENEAKFINPSGTGEVLSDLAKMSALASAAVTAVATGAPAAIMTAVGGVSMMGASRMMSRLMTDPIFVKAAIRAATAKNQRSYFQALNRMIPQIQEALRDVAIAEDINDGSPSGIDR